MQKKLKQKIVIIGCGNLARHLAKHFFLLKKFDVFVYNHRTNKDLEIFKEQFNFKIKSNLSGIISDAEYYFICVSDKYISEVSKKIKPAKASSLVMHTSGSKDLDELSKHLKNVAVFYPLQTFSKSADVNWKQVPILLEGNNNTALKKASEIARLFSENVILLNSLERAKVHLAAVLVNNFTNSLYVAANNFLSEKLTGKKVDFKILLPLIRQTTDNLSASNPSESQTGPAKRNDKNILKQHKKLLEKDKELRKIYKLMSDLIKKQQN